MVLDQYLVKAEEPSPFPVDWDENATYSTTLSYTHKGVPSVEKGTLVTLPCVFLHDPPKGDACWVQRTDVSQLGVVVRVDQENKTCSVLCPLLNAPDGGVKYSHGWVFEQVPFRYLERVVLGKSKVMGVKMTKVHLAICTGTFGFGRHLEDKYGVKNIYARQIGKGGVEYIGPPLVWDGKCRCVVTTSSFPL